MDYKAKIKKIKHFCEEEWYGSRIFIFGPEKAWYISMYLFVSVILKTDFERIVKKSTFFGIFRIKRFHKLVEKEIEEIQQRILNNETVIVNKLKLIFWQDIVKPEFFNIL